MDKTALLIERRGRLIIVKAQETDRKIIEEFLKETKETITACFFCENDPYSTATLIWAFIVSDRSSSARITSVQILECESFKLFETLEKFLNENPIVTVTSINVNTFSVLDHTYARIFLTITE